jgi:hypothetical protein
MTSGSDPLLFGRRAGTAQGLESSLAPSRVAQRVHYLGELWTGGVGLGGMCGWSDPPRRPLGSAHEWCVGVWDIYRRLSYTGGTLLAPRRLPPSPT